MNEEFAPSRLTVLVTGAGSGIGRATAQRFGRAGARIIASDLNLTALANLQDEFGGRCHATNLDVRDQEQTVALLNTLPADFAGVDVVVANAGLAVGMDLAQTAHLADWKTMVDVNIQGLLNTVHTFLPGMVARNRGHILLMGSVGGDYPYPGGSVYGATKAFVKQLALNLRADLIGTALRVTNIEPGVANTNFQFVRLKGDADKARQALDGFAPLQPEDIAETIFWSATLPSHVNINRLQVMPVSMSFGPYAFHRE